MPDFPAIDDAQPDVAAIIAAAAAMLDAHDRHAVAILRERRRVSGDGAAYWDRLLAEVNRMLDADKDSDFLAA